MPMLRPRTLKILATLAASPALALLVLFTLGETVGGDLSGLQHLVELAPLAGLVALGWARPRAGGLALAAISLGAGIAYAFLGPMGARSIVAVVSTEALLFVPPLIAGALFLAAARAEIRDRAIS